MFPEDKNRSQKFSKILAENGFTKNEIGIAIIDLKESNPEIFGHNIEHFIYPASVYKIFIGAEILRRIEKGELSLSQTISMRALSDLPVDVRIFPQTSRIETINVGDVVSIDKLLAYMLADSNNLASVNLLALVGNDSIRINIIERYGWYGSGLQKDVLIKMKNNLAFRYAETTTLCARHVAEFFYLVEKNTLISPFVSQKLKEYMLQWNRQGRKGLSITDYVSYYRKGGYLENNLYLPFYREYYKKAGFALDYAAIGIFRLIKTIFTKGWVFIRWVNDAGVVKGEKSHYVISVFSVNKQINPYKKFPMERLAKIIYRFMEKGE